MKIYSDKDLSKEVSILDLGIVLAGETKKFTFYVENNSSAHIKNLEFTVSHPEVEVMEAPEELSAFTSDKLIIKWSPSITLKEGLKAQLDIKGVEIWG